jgi:uncharacterized protein
MALPHDMPTFILLAVTMFVAGLARGFSGFGAALIFVPLASRLVGPQQAAPLLLLTDGFLALPLALSTWRLALRREVAWMALGGLTGIPFGALALSLGDPLVLRWIIVGLAALMLALLLSGWRYHGAPHASATVGVGVVSGLFSGIAQIGGPPVVAYWLGGGHEPKRMRASTILYFVFSTLISGVAYFYGGLLTREILWLAVLLVAPFGAGLYLGTRVFNLARPEIFRAICLWLIALSVLLGLPLWTPS